MSVSLGSTFGPEGIIIRNGISYVAQSSNTFSAGGTNGAGIYTCTVDAQKQFTGCTSYGTSGTYAPFTLATVNYPTQIALSPDGTVLYMATYHAHLWSCSVSGTTISSCSVQIAGGPNDKMGGVALNAAGDLLYVAGYRPGIIVSCPVNGLTVSPCTTVADGSVLPIGTGDWGITIV